MALFPFRRSVSRPYQRNHNPTMPSNITAVPNITPDDGSGTAPSGEFCSGSGRFPGISLPGLPGLACWIAGSSLTGNSPSVIPPEGGASVPPRREVPGRSGSSEGTGSCQPGVSKSQLYSESPNSGSKMLPSRHHHRRCPSARGIPTSTYRPPPRLNWIAARLASATVLHHHRGALQA